MAGYVTKSASYIYDSFTAAEELANGVFAEVDDGEIKALTAAGTMVAVVEEKTTLNGKEAVVIKVIAEGDNELYFVENAWDVNDGGAYTEANYTVPVGALCRAHQPVKGDWLIMNVEAELYAALEVGDKVNPAAEGTIAKVIAEGDATD